VLKQCVCQLCENVSFNEVFKSSIVSSRTINIKLVENKWFCMSVSGPSHFIWSIKCEMKIQHIITPTLNSQHVVKIKNCVCLLIIQ